MAVNKIYLDKLVSGASIRDDNGKRISTNYVPKTEFETYKTEINKTLGDIETILDNIIGLTTAYK